MTERLELRLYVAGDASQSRRARRNVRDMLERHGESIDVTLDIVDLKESPSAAIDNDILAIPTLERVAPKPRQRVIGSLDELDTVWNAVSS